MMMKKDDLKVAAEELENSLDAYAKAGNVSAQNCLRMLNPLIDSARRMEIDQPVSEVPCGYTFHEGELADYGDLEEKYSKFAFLAKNRDIDKVKKALGLR